MAIESDFNYIQDLDETLPLSNDTRKQGDDHIRGVKKSLKGTFSGFVGTTLSPVAVASSEADLNKLLGAGAQSENLLLFSQSAGIKSTSGTKVGIKYNLLKETAVSGSRSLDCTQYNAYYAENATGDISLTLTNMQEGQQVVIIAKAFGATRYLSVVGGATVIIEHPSPTGGDSREFGGGFGGYGYWLATKAADIIFVGCFGVVGA